jgi:2-iminobutanoate/2-iminopropanoate deaminase
MEGDRMTIEKIDLNPEFGFAFSSCVVAGDYVYTSHHSGFQYEEGTWPKSVAEQTEECFRKLERTLQAAGVTLKDVVKTTVLLKNAGDFPEMNKVYRRQFTDGYPARTGMVTGFLDAECRVQIEAVAYKPR